MIIQSNPNFITLVTVKKPVFDKVSKYWYLQCQLYAVLENVPRQLSCQCERIV